MDFIKDIYEAWGARIKSNVFGSIAIAFVFVNWKVLFFLLFADVRVETKFNYFDANTDWLSLYVFPLCFGSVLALGLPFTNDWVHRVVSKPVSRVRSREDELAHQRLKQKNEWEEERIREKELYARDLISDAQIDQEIENTIEDEDIREELKEKLSGERGRFYAGRIASENDSRELDSEIIQRNPLSAMELLVLTKAKDEGFVTYNDKNNPYNALSESEAMDIRLSSDAWFPSGASEMRAQTEFNSAVHALVERGVMEMEYNGSNDSFHFRPSVLGFRILDAYVRQEAMGPE